MENAVKQSNVSKSLQLLRTRYERDSRPWVVAYSGGKDSTVVLQLVYNLLLSLRAEGQIVKPVYVISSDTRVESPNVAAYVSNSLERVRIAATNAGLPLHVELVTPSAAESFWGKIIGLGYPSPTRWFRWCTSNMKIKPSRRAIEKITTQHGSVILMLGSRKDESAHRANSIMLRNETDDGLNRHHEIPDALTLKPIVDWTTDEVWEYLSENDPPWGGDHSFMISLYRKANGGECPVVLDLETPSCGGSRFGCWTCTVVKEDKSMQGFIESGETELQPLKDFRDWLKEIRDDNNRRSQLSRDGKVARPGPFTPEARKEILTRLLATEKKVGFELIADEDLQFIQEQWRKEFDYSETVSKIVSAAGREFSMANAVKPIIYDDPILEESAAEFEFSVDLAYNLLRTVRAGFADLGRWGAKKQMDDDIANLIIKDVNQAEKADIANDF